MRRDEINPRTVVSQKIETQFGDWIVSEAHVYDEIGQSFNPNSELFGQYGWLQISFLMKTDNNTYFGRPALSYSRGVQPNGIIVDVEGIIQESEDSVRYEVMPELAIGPFIIGGLYRGEEIREIAAREVGHLVIVDGNRCPEPKVEYDDLLELDRSLEEAVGKTAWALATECLRNELAARADTQR